MPPPPSATPADSAATARGAINSALPSVSCTWLDIGAIAANGNSVNVAMRGVAGDEAVARDQLGAALTQAGVSGATIDFGDVAEITQAGCAALDAFRQIRSPEGGHLTSTAPRYEMTVQQDGSYAGREASNPLIDLDLSDPSRELALLGIEPSGKITLLLRSRAQFEQALAQSVGGRPVSREGNGRYRIHIDSDHEGWSGLLLITGRGPIDADLLAPDVGERGPAWRDRLLTAAAAGRWSAEMVWYESVNGQADAGGGKP
jgi:serine/threonine-protein kinase